MLTRASFALVAVASALASGVSCSGDDTGNATGATGTGGSSAAGGGAGSGGGAATGGGGATSGGASGSGGGADASPGVDLCNNTADIEGVHAKYDAPGTEGGTNLQTLNQVAKQCGIDCLFAHGEDEAAQRVCATDCIQEVTGAGISLPCTSCVILSVECGRTYCLNECIGSDEALCDRCLCGENSLGVNCLIDYEACSGIPNTTCGDAGA